jgi:hypothetical protein
LGLTYPVLSDFDQTVWNAYGPGYGRPLNLVIDQHMVILWKEEGYEPGLAEPLAVIEEALPHPPLAGPEDPVDGEPAWSPTSPVLNWADSPSVGTGHDVTNYYVQVALDDQFTQLVLDQTTPDAVSEWPVPGSTFVAGTQYYWRVAGSDDGGVTWGTWSSVWTFTVDPAFAIELGSLRALWRGGLSVAVEWTTVTETDAYGFHVLRAATAGGDYARVTRRVIPAQGSGGSGAAYSYVDDVPSPGTYFYRLEERELAGTQNRYGPVSVVVGVPTVGLAVKRNPTDGELVLLLQTPGDGAVVLELLDVNARLVGEKDLGVLSSGAHTVRWEFRRPVPPGHYTVRVCTGERQAAATVVLTR